MARRKRGSSGKEWTNAEDSDELTGSHGTARGAWMVTAASSPETASAGRHRGQAFLHGFALVRLTLSPGGKEELRGGLNRPELDQRWLVVAELSW